jgi:hypothetical protein
MLKGTLGAGLPERHGDRLGKSVTEESERPFDRSSPGFGGCQQMHAFGAKSPFFLLRLAKLLQGRFL